MKKLSTRLILQLVSQSPGFLLVEPFERGVRRETRQPFRGATSGRFGIFQPSDCVALRIGTLWNPGRSGGGLRRGNAGGACIFSIGFQHSDDRATRLGPHFYECVDGGEIDFDALLGEEFRDAAVGRSATTFRRNELPVGFQFGGRVRHRETSSNKLKQLSNKFERCLSLLEVLRPSLVAVQGKMSVGFFAGEGRSQNEVGSSVGTGTHWKGERRCFG